jgi:hypothetical protein
LIRKLTAADVTGAMLPRPWRLVRDTGCCYIVDALGGRLCEPNSHPEASTPMQLLVELANSHPNATLEQILRAGMQALLEGA